MHQSSIEKARAFRDAYLTGGERVLDVGSMAHLEHDSYRPIFAGCEYVGLDLAPGPNVDLVPADPFSWAEIASGSFDVVISGQTFEHNPYPWVTLAEIARVLRPGGVVFVTAPSRGPVHRFPLDCWRFYPDSAAALCGYVGLELVETFTESGTEWGDWMMIARATEVDPGRLEQIVRTRAALPVVDTAGPGPVAATYLAWAERQPRKSLRKRVRRRLHDLLRGS